MAIKDITRKTERPNGRRGRPAFTKAYKLARFLASHKNGATYKEVKSALGFDPAPYIAMYDCFEAVERGRYKYTGKALRKLEKAS